MIFSSRYLSALAQGETAIRDAIEASGGAPVFRQLSPGFSATIPPAQLAALIPALMDPLRPDGLILLHDAQCHMTAAGWDNVLAAGLDPGRSLMDPKRQFLGGPQASVHNRAPAGIMSISFGGMGMHMGAGSNKGAPKVRNIIAQPMDEFFQAVMETSPAVHQEELNALAQTIGLSSYNDDYDEDDFSGNGNDGPAFKLTAVIAPGAGDSLTHWAAACGNVDLLNAIAARSPGAIEAKNAKQQTPLHLASLFLRKDAVQCLLGAGAAIDPLDVQRYTPLAAALLFSTQQYPEVQWNEGHKEALMKAQAEVGCHLLNKGALYDKGPGRTLQSVIMSKNAELSTYLKASYEMFKMETQISAGASAPRSRL